MVAGSCCMQYAPMQYAGRVSYSKVVGHCRRPRATRYAVTARKYKQSRASIRLFPLCLTLPYRLRCSLAFPFRRRYPSAFHSCFIRSLQYFCFCFCFSSPLTSKDAHLLAHPPRHGQSGSVPDHHFRRSSRVKQLCSSNVRPLPIPSLPLFPTHSSPPSSIVS